tara:strand:+ start:4962 stop:5381 length:420 start_codon:yes stop_codon:yes gene_type:complete
LGFRTFAPAADGPNEIEVIFAALVDDVVAVIAELLINGSEFFGQPNGFFRDVLTGAAMIMNPQAGLHATKCDGRAGGGADSRRHIRAIKPHPIRGQLIDIRSGDGIISVGPHPVVHVFDKDPNDIRRAGRFCLILSVTG